MSRLNAAADDIAEIGYLFAEGSNGSALAALDAYLPRPDSWK